MVKESSINSDFKTSPFYGLKPLSKDEILIELEKNYDIYIVFKKYGNIDCKRYPFITKATFSTYEKNCIEGEKNEEEKLQARENLKIVEDYFNSRHSKHAEPLRVTFAERRDNECVLYNPDRFNNKSIQERLVEIFI